MAQGNTGSKTRTVKGETTGSASPEAAVRYAKQIDSLDQHEDHPGQTLVTRNHDVIRHWAEERGAKPATIKGYEQDHRRRPLRLDFPGYAEGGALLEIPWDEWFRTFDERHLLFIYQEHRSDGTLSNFFHLDNPSQ